MATDHAAQAATLLAHAQDADPEAKSEDVALMVQFAQAHATIAVAAELGQLRESVEGVADALKDNDGFGAGDHLHYISDWLKTISERR